MSDSSFEADTVPNGFTDPSKVVPPAAKKLCEKCQELDLTVERFIIDGDQESKKVKSSLLPRPITPRVTDFTVKSRSTTHTLGSLEEIQGKSQTCPLCSLLIKSISDSVAGKDLSTPTALNTICSVNWEIDGHQSHPKDAATKRGRARRLRVQWNDERLKDSYLVILMPEKYHRPNSDAGHNWNRDAHYLGRNIDEGEGKQALIKSWIDICCKSHGRPCGSSASEEEFIKMTKEHSFFGVIDVVDLQLKPLPARLPDGPLHGEAKYGAIYKLTEGHAPFVALSYVWGQGKAYTTTARNILQHIRHGGLEKHFKELPKTIRDAIQLTHSIGLRYIWIDSLCIVQDRQMSWNLNARAMDLIYGNALVTICAADGEDSSTGLVALRPSGLAQQHSEVCAPGVSLMITRPPETSIKASAWNKRAWTFQARLLSPRCLIFVDGRVYFQCRSTGMSEDIVADRNGQGWSLDLVHAPLQMLRELERSAISVYANCVELYTSRQLMQAKDVLVAFNGMLNYMKGTLRAPFIFGLPSSHFDFALLWEQTGTIRRRRPRTELEIHQYNGVEFPSWSWCGWMEHEGGNGNSIKYKTDLLEGCLINVHQWLMNHTWIRWYIRDGHGKLRPLWGKHIQPDGTIDERWKGYKINHHSRNKMERQEPERQPMLYDPDYPRNNMERQEPERRPMLYDPEYPRERQESEGIMERKLRRPRPRSRSRSRSNSERIEREYYGPPSPKPPSGRERNIIRETYRHYQPKREQLVLKESSPYSEDTSPYHEEDTRILDEYGRYIPARIAAMDCEFKLTLPEVPYHVLLEENEVEPSVEFPDQPILQFFTFHYTLNLIPSDSDNPHPGAGLCRCDIADDMGDWCGSILLEKTWIEKTMFSKQEFIAISDAKSFTKDECNTWTYYVPKEREESEWDLFYVLLIEPYDWGYQRVALGKVFKAAFADSEWKEIMLG